VSSVSRRLTMGKTFPRRYRRSHERNGKPSGSSTLKPSIVAESMNGFIRTFAIATFRCSAAASLFSSCRCTIHGKRRKPTAVYTKRRIAAAKNQRRRRTISRCALPTKPLPNATGLFLPEAMVNSACHWRRSRPSRGGSEGAQLLSTRDGGTHPRQLGASWSDLPWRRFQRHPEGRAQDRTVATIV